MFAYGLQLNGTFAFLSLVLFLGAVFRIRVARGISYEHFNKRRGYESDSNFYLDIWCKFIILQIGKKGIWCWSRYCVIWQHRGREFGKMKREPNVIHCERWNGKFWQICKPRCNNVRRGELSIKLPLTFMRIKLPVSRIIFPNRGIITVYLSTTRRITFSLAEREVHTSPRGKEHFSRPQRIVQPAIE